MIQSLKSLLVIALVSFACQAQTITSWDSTASHVNIAAGTNSTLTVNSTGTFISDVPGVIPGEKAVKPAHFKIADSDIASPEYRELARSIGAVGASEEAELVSLLHDMGLEVYEQAKVNQYLTQSAVNAGKWSWSWRPLREKDANAVDGATRVAAVPLTRTLYSRVVPSEVLGIAAGIVKSLPKAVLLVSDYDDRRPDPFLAVTTPNMLANGRIWIIAEWDEPGFGKPVNDVTLSQARGIFVPAGAAPDRIELVAGDTTWRNR